MSGKKITKYTNCGICLAACGMEIEVEDNRIVRIRGDKNHPLSKGFLCPKGRAAADYDEDRLRVTYPYEKVGSAWNRIGWDEAYAKIIDRLKSIIADHGPRSVAMYYGAGNPLSSMNIQSAMGFLRALGSDRMYNVLTVEFTNRYYVMEKMYGRQYRVSQPDLENTHFLLLFGHNPLVSLDHPGISASLGRLKRRGARMVVVDPRKTETARIADRHVEIDPGTDLYMLQAMLHHILKNNLHDKDFLEKHAINYEFFKQFQFMTPEEAEPLCGVPARHIGEVAETFAAAESASAVCKLGILTSPNSTVSYWLVEALNCMTGNVDKPGGLIFNPGILDMDKLLWIATMGKRPKSYFGGYPYLTGSFPASELPREILTDDTDRVRALIVDAGNPALIFPNSKRATQALKRLDLLVSIDVYMNETAQEADFFLPAAHFLEKEDCYVTFPEHQPYPFGQWSHKIVEPKPEAKPEWEIFSRLSREMGVPILNSWPIDMLFRVGETMDSRRGKKGKLSFNPQNYYRLLLGLFGKTSLSCLLSNPHGVKAGDIVFGNTMKKIGKIDVAPKEFVESLINLEPPVLKTKSFPLTLITGERSIVTKCTNLRGATRLTERYSENFVRIHPDDAAARSITDGDLVRVSTRSGETDIKAKVDTNIRRGVLSIPAGWGRKLFHPESSARETKGANPNQLTDDLNLDPLVGMPIYNAIPCAVTRVVASAQ